MRQRHPSILACALLGSLLLLGCDDGSASSEKQLGCGANGTVLELPDGTPVGCIYDKTLIIETGFSCPDPVPFAHELSGSLVCTASDLFQPATLDAARDTLGLPGGALPCSPGCGADLVCDPTTGACSAMLTCGQITNDPCPTGCEGPEICDGIDNDCDGMIDESPQDLGDTCIVGVGVCEATGRPMCAAGALTCDATAGQPTERACDCQDNDCDGMIDEFGLKLEPTDGPLVPADAEWDIATVNGRAYAAVESGAAIDIYDVDAGERLTTIEDARDPRLFSAAASDELAVFFIRNHVGLDVSGDELHVLTLERSGAVGTSVCVTCDDIGRGSRGPVVDYSLDLVNPDVATDAPSDVGCTPTETLGDACRYVVGFVRSNGQLATLLMGAPTFEVFPRSIGLVLNFNNQNEGMVTTHVESTSSLVYALLTREQDVALVLLQGIDADEGGHGGRSQWLRFASISPTVSAASGGHDLELLDERSDGALDALLALSDGSAVTVSRWTPQSVNRDFGQTFSATITPATPGEVSNPRIEAVCERSAIDVTRGEPGFALLTYDVKTATGTVVEGLLIDRDTGELVHRAPTALGGAGARLIKDADGLMWLGVLAAPEGGSELVDGELAAPSMAPIRCDAT